MLGEGAALAPAGRARGRCHPLREGDQPLVRPGRVRLRRRAGVGRGAAARLPLRARGQPRVGPGRGVREFLHEEQEREGEEFAKEERVGCCVPKKGAAAFP